MRRCFVFPGQGAQYPGMGGDLLDRHPEARDVFATASDVSGFDVAALAVSGSEEELKATDRSQVAITAVSLAVLRILGLRGITSSGAAGFSLGEYAALVDSGILTDRDALALVTHRGRIMEAVSRSQDSAGGAAGMAAVIGLDVGAIEQALAAAGVVGVYAANINSPAQTVLSGTAEGLQAAESVLKAAGAKRFVPLKVSGPFHSPLMAEARERFSEVLAGVRFSDPVKPVYSNVTGSRLTTGEEARTLCADQLVKPVRWVDEEEAIVRDGYDALLEVGPGEVLAALWRAFTKVHPEVTVPCMPAGTAEQIQSVET